MADVCLVVVFNHRFERNLGTLDRIYKDRFSNVKYLMPFYEGDRSDVIPVYESSYQFQGFFAQAYDRFYDGRYSHYIFVADDMLLNPHLDERNIVAELGLDAETAYIEDLVPVTAQQSLWRHTGNAFDAFSYAYSGTSHNGELPETEEALGRYAALGISYDPSFSLRTARQWVSARDLDRLLHHPPYRSQVWHFLRRRRIPYPLLKAYSDFLVVPGTSIRRFCHLCGVFAAMRLFVEIAIPTALALTCASVRAERRLYGRGESGPPRTGPANVRYKGITIWRGEGWDAIWPGDNRDLRAFLRSFHEDWLYVHPVKLSQWRYDD